MITLYTSLGKLKIKNDANGNKYPIILLGEKQMLVDPYEMILWSTLAFSILTLQETRSEFYGREKDLHILSDLDFEHYIRRLTFRGLIASGIGYTSMDALHNLLDPLFIHPLSFVPFSKFIRIIHMFFIKHFPISVMTKILKKEKLSRSEREVLNLCRANKLSEDNDSVLLVASLYLKKRIIFESY